MVHWAPSSLLSAQLKTSISLQTLSRLCKTEMMWLLLLLHNNVTPGQCEKVRLLLVKLHDTACPFEQVKLTAESGPCRHWKLILLSSLHLMRKWNNCAGKISLVCLGTLLRTVPTPVSQVICLVYKLKNFKIMAVLTFKIDSFFCFCCW